ncbi:MAG: TetR/AcrR family transcriptional regulator [Cohaesibacter sp.]|jgi:AcrR family transcriptional regulator|nr:TetR/AcrR family transcriptional regulator [Cohaesibacter sp.]
MEAAFRVLAEKGYRSTSMLSIAKEASASNQTLYRWYGSKEELFSALVKQNALEATELLQKTIEKPKPVEEVLLKLGVVLLQIVTSKRAILLNRAAAADASETGKLGQTIAEFGRLSVYPLLLRYFEKAAEAGELALPKDNTGSAVETYFNLLIGDIQIRRVIGVVGVLKRQDAQQRSKRACAQFIRLYGCEG